MKKPNVMKLLDPKLARGICWGRPDSPQRDLCALCHGPLDEAPVRLWKNDGSGAAFCDECFDKLIGMSNAQTQV